MIKAPSKSPFSGGTTTQSSAPKQGGLSGKSSVKPPKYIDYNTTEDAAQNVLAQGQANSDLRCLTKASIDLGSVKAKARYRGAVRVLKQ